MDSTLGASGPHQRTMLPIPVARPLLGGNEKRYVNEALDSTMISSSGSFLPRFETAFAQALATPGHEVNWTCHAVSNGTSALHLALLALGIRPGDEVVVPSLTYVATAAAVLYCGAVPVFADVDSSTWNATAETYEPCITSKTRVLIVVHLVGDPVDMDPLMELARRHNLFVIEDAAESHGAVYKGRMTGTIGTLATFSFYGNKNLATGEGGMVVVPRDSESLASSFPTEQGTTLSERILMLKGQGMSFTKKYWHPTIGFNYRMTNLQAAIGLAQVEQLEGFLAQRRSIFKRYRLRLEPAEQAGILELQATTCDSAHACWMFPCILSSAFPDRDSVIKKLSERGIETRPMFFPVESMPPYPQPQGVPDCVNSATLSARGIMLPTFCGLTDDQIDLICSELLTLCDIYATAGTSGDDQLLPLGLREEYCGITYVRVGVDPHKLAAFFLRNAGSAPYFNPFPLTFASAESICNKIAAGAQDAYYILLDKEGHSVGFFMNRGYDEGYAVPSFGLLVDVNHRDRGIGKLMLALGAHEARKRGDPSIRMTVFEENSVMMKAVAKMKTWRETGRELTGGHAKIVFYMNLNLCPN